MIETLQQLHWIRPAWLLLIPVAVILFIAIYRLRSKSSGWYQHIDPSLIEFLLDNPANHNVRASSALPLIAAALACCIAIVAMAGPSWEKLPTVTEQKTDALVIIADLTLSMHATDIKPSRLVRARYKLLELLKQRNEGQTALIAYSGDAHTVSPLTDDARTIAALVPPLIMMINLGKGIGIFRVGLMMATSLVATGFYIKSFVDARRSRSASS